MIRNFQRRIQISIPESSTRWRWFKSLFNGFEFGFQKRFEWLLDKRDSNPYSTNSNPNSSKVCLDGLIRISIQKIRIPGKGRSEVKSEGFESPTNRFKSLIKNKWRDWSTNSNLLHNDSNPWIWSYEEQVKAIRIFELWIRIPSQIEVESQTERFESSSYGFESLLGVKFKIYKGDSNHLHNDLNPSFYRSIKCVTCNSNNPIFKSNLSNNG